MEGSQHNGNVTVTRAKNDILHPQTHPPTVTKLGMRQHVDTVMPMVFYIHSYMHVTFTLTHKHRHKDNRKIEEDHTFNYPIQIVSLGDKRQDM